MKRPNNSERFALQRIGAEPAVRPKKNEWPTLAITEKIQQRTGQTFIYHTCDFVTSSWSTLQHDLNDLQRSLETLYGPFVECINVYRKNATKDNGQCVVAIFKVFLGRP